MYQKLMLERIVRLERPVSLHGDCIFSRTCPTFNSPIANFEVVLLS